MAITTSNLIMGAGTLWRGAFGVTEPATIATEPGAGWTDLGGTTDGVTLVINQEYSEMAVDQVVDIPGRRLVKRDVTIATNMAEATLANLLRSMNDNGAIAGTTTETLTPTFASSASQPTYACILFDGYAPNGKRRRVIVRKVLSVDNPEMAYKKDGQTVLKVMWSAHFVTPLIAPFVVLDDVSA